MFHGNSHLESDKICKQQEAQEKLEAEWRIREAQEAARSAEGATKCHLPQKRDASVTIYWFL